MPNYYQGEEKRSSLGKQIRLTLDNEITHLRMLYSSLYRAEKQHLPANSVRALQAACQQAAMNIQKMGLPQHRVEEIRKQVS
jgi:hypothetical protein